jgi:REP element-mobilizing transposase RayT
MERFYRRRLPHWRFDAPLVIYFVTWRLAVRHAALSAAERDVVAETIRHWEGTRCRHSAWVVMDDHVHVVVAPLTGEPLESLVHSWKSYSAHRLMAGGRSAPLWQHEPFDRLVRSDLELARTILYVCSNPLKRWPELTEYKWVWPGLRQLA